MGPLTHLRKKYSVLIDQGCRSFNDSFYDNPMNFVTPKKKIQKIRRKSLWNDSTLPNNTCFRNQYIFHCWYLQTFVTRKIKSKKQELHLKAAELANYGLTQAIQVL